MAEPTDNTDAGYENSRRKAEQTFFFASVDWLERVVREAEKFPIPPKPDVKKIIAEAWAAGLRGEELKPEKEPKRRFSSDLILKLVEMCHKYGEAELRAYAALLERKGVPPSQAVTELERHAEETLAEIHKRKWTRNIEENVTGLFDNEPWIEGSWHFVEDRIREFLHDDLHNWVWFHQDGWAFPDEEAEAREAEADSESAEELVSRRDWVDTFLIRCLQETQLKVTRTHIWRAAGHQTARQFQFWQASSPKATAQDDQNFRRILAMNPADFEALLRKKGII